MEGHSRLGEEHRFLGWGLGDGDSLKENSGLKGDLRKFKY